jgi:hypothetical protein
MSTLVELLKNALVLYTIAAPALLPLIIMFFVFGTVSTWPLVLGAVLAVAYNVGRRRLLSVEVVEK